MRQSKFLEHSNSESELTRACREILITRGAEGVACTVQDDRAGSVVVKLEVVICYSSSHTEASPIRHRLRRKGKVRPAVLRNLADGEHAQQWTQPVRGRGRELSMCAAAPGDDEWKRFRDLKCGLEIIRGKNVVVVDKYDHFSG